MIQRMLGDLGQSPQLFGNFLEVPTLQQSNGRPLMEIQPRKREKFVSIVLTFHWYLGKKTVFAGRRIWPSFFPFIDKIRVY